MHRWRWDYQLIEMKYNIMYVLLRVEVGIHVAKPWLSVHGWRWDYQLIEMKYNIMNVNHVAKPWLSVEVGLSVDWEKYKYTIVFTCERYYEVIVFPLISFEISWCNICCNINSFQVIYSFSRKLTEVQQLWSSKVLF